MGDSRVLIVPAVSAGNVPQLAVDLLIHSFGAKLVDRLDDKYVYPFAGPRDYVRGEESQGMDGISTAVEVYQTHGTTIIQMRAPTLPGCRTQFVREVLLPYMAKHGFSEVIVLGSSNAGMREVISTDDRIRIYSNGVSERMAQLSLSSKPEAPPKQLQESGYTLDLLKLAPGAVPSVSAIVRFAYEGDNCDDAEELATTAVQVAGLTIPMVWKRPISWEGVYGKPVPIGVEEGLYS
jgi:proteasome chaperone 2